MCGIVGFTGNHQAANIVVMIQQELLCVMVKVRPQLLRQRDV